MTTERLNELVIKLAQKLVDAVDDADANANSKAYWFGEYTKVKNELEELKNKIKKVKEDMSNGNS